MVKKNGKLGADGPVRVRSISWDEEHTRFMLNWYIEYKKQQHAGFVWKKTHHAKCADVLNKEFGMGVTVEQVNRHCRDYKEKWKIIEPTLNNSGNGFDVSRCKLTIFKSEKEKLNVYLSNFLHTTNCMLTCTMQLMYCIHMQDRERRLLSKPVKFFEEMQELFKGSYADGSLAMDPGACLDGDKDSDSDDSGGINDIVGYAAPIDLEGDDSDTLPSPQHKKNSPSYAPSEDNSSPSTRSGKKRARGVKSPSKKAPKSRFSDATADISTSMKAITKCLSEPPPPPPAPKLDNPHAELWRRIEALPICTDDKIIVGQHLARAENEGMRGWLDGSSDTTLQTWVYKFLCDKEGN